MAPRQSMHGRRATPQPTLEPLTHSTNATSVGAVGAVASHLQILTIQKLGFNQVYYTYIVLIKIVLRSKFP